jgi:hypothetical protein
VSLHTREANNQDAAQSRRLVFSILAEHGLQPDPSTTDADLADIEQNYQRYGVAPVRREHLARRCDQAWALDS